MNELIRQLAEQAGYKHPDAVGECEDYAYFDHEKFAQLIVKKCIQIVENEASTYAEPVWAVELVNDIQEHFEL